MELQRILARDTRSAMEQVFNLYGDDAMIVANNRVKGQTEIIVAMDLVSEVKAALIKPLEAASQDQSASQFGQLIEAHMQVKSEDQRADISDHSEISFGTAFEPFSAATAISKKPALDPLVTASLENVSNALNGENYKEAADREYLKAREIVDLVKQELSLMRDDYKLSQHKDSWTGRLAVNEEMGPLVEAFNESGGDDHCRLNSSCHFRLTSHALIGRGSKSADTHSRTNDDQPSSKKTCELNERAGICPASGFLSAGRISHGKGDNKSSGNQKNSCSKSRANLHGKGLLRIGGKIDHKTI